MPAMRRPEALTIHAASHVPAESLAVELQAIQAESIGWLPLGAAYLHVADTEQQVIEVVGVALAGMADTHVLWLV
jgi:hypothetical protein